MNYLAHTLLSKNSIDYQMTNVAADTLKGKAWPQCNQIHHNALSMHKKIDSFTDTHACVQQAKKHLGSGYLRGVIIDITFDHFICKHWDTFVTKKQHNFINDFYKNAHTNKHQMPLKAQEFVERLIQYDFLNQYHTLESLFVVFERFNKRLSHKLLAKEAATDYIPHITCHYEEIEKNFLQFFPDLITMFLAHSQATPEEHYFFISSEDV